MHIIFSFADFLGNVRKICSFGNKDSYSKKTDVLREDKGGRGHVISQKSSHTFLYHKGWGGK